jgi:6-hydroxycyclohex-1-ene-1-carbonyl-CoA dehydrogenase
VGGFGVQIAASLGATVVALDVDEARLDLMARHGAALTLDARRSFKEIRRINRELAQQREIPTWRQRIFETSGTTQGQELAFGLLGHGGYLGVVGYAAGAAEIRLSNLMALDATAQGNWGCLPERYPEVLDLVLTGRVALEPFVETRPLDSIADAFSELRAHRVTRRIILIPES